MNTSWVSTGWLFLHNYSGTLGSGPHKPLIVRRKPSSERFSPSEWQNRDLNSGSPLQRPPPRKQLSRWHHRALLGSVSLREAVLVAGGLAMWCRSHCQHPAGKWCWIIFLSKLALLEIEGVTASNYSSPPFACVLWPHSEAQKRRISRHGVPVDCCERV